MTVTGVEIRQAYEMWNRINKIIWFTPDDGTRHRKWRNWLDPTVPPEDVFSTDQFTNYECSETVARKIKLLCSPNGYALCKAMMAQQVD